jgi:hypothetical protein
MAETDSLGRTPVILVVFLTIVTCGAYVPIWYIRRRSILSGLNTSTKPPRYLPYGLLSLYFVLFVDIVLVGAGVSLFPAAVSADEIYSIVSFVHVLVNMFLAFTAVDILDEYSCDGLTTHRSLAWIRAIVLSVIYLQYEMNRLPAPVDGVCPPPKDT